MKILKFRSDPLEIKIVLQNLKDFVVTDRIGEKNADASVEIKSTYFQMIDLFELEMSKRFEDNEKILVAERT